MTPNLSQQASIRALIDVQDNGYTITVPFHNALYYQGLSARSNGANPSVGTATLVAGTVTIPTTRVTATSCIFTQVQALGTVVTAKATSVTRAAGVSITITSADATDTSVVQWWIIEPIIY